VSDRESTAKKKNGKSRTLKELTEESAIPFGEAMAKGLKG